MDKQICDFFNMSCELCTIVFDSFRDVCSHYPDAHGVYRGYVKCCERKFFIRDTAIEHINWHSNPEMFKCETYTIPTIINERILNEIFRFLYIDVPNVVNYLVPVRRWNVTMPYSIRRMKSEPSAVTFAKVDLQGGHYIDNR